MRPVMRLNCTNCGDVLLKSEDFVVAEARPPYESSFDFICPYCYIPQAKLGVPTRVVRALGSVGVRVVSSAQESPKFEYQDILDFCKILQDGSWEEDLRKNL